MVGLKLSTPMRASVMVKPNTVCIVRVAPVEAEHRKHFVVFDCTDGGIDVYDPSSRESESYLDYTYRLEWESWRLISWMRVWYVE